MKEMSTWNELFEALVAFVETGTSRAAGEQLGLTGNAIINRITRLEKRLNCLMVNRSKQTKPPLRLYARKLPELSDDGRRWVNGWRAGSELKTWFNNEYPCRDCSFWESRDRLVGRCEFIHEIHPLINAETRGSWGCCFWRGF